MSLESQHTSPPPSVQHPLPKQGVLKSLGSLAYKEAWDIQEKLLNEIVATKLANRKLGLGHQKLTRSYLLFCEHPHVYTMGKNTSASHLLVNKATLQKQGVDCYVTNRGGDITYHGPGQLVVYPILDLENFFTDLHRYLRLLEEAVIATLKDFDLLGGSIQGLTGVWIDHENPLKASKICAIGIRTSRWVTMHGLALNVNTDLSYFRQIVPCGIRDKQVTSMAAELGAKQDLQVVEQRLAYHLLRLFGIERVER